MGQADSVKWCEKIADCPEFRSSVFIHQDESLEVRRQKMLQKVKSRAVADGKQVFIKDDALYVNGSIVFSLSQGFVRTQAESNSGFMVVQDGQ